MVRRYSEPVEVKATSPPTTAPDGCAESDDPVTTGAPEAFIWRGRLYIVREILAHWRERRAWWREALDPPAGQPHGIAAAARERQVWRVEACPGRLARSGVFDLARDDPADHPGVDPERYGDELAADAGQGSAGQGLAPRSAQESAAHGPAAHGSAAHEYLPTGWQLLRVAD